MHEDEQAFRGCGRVFDLSEAFESHVHKHPLFFTEVTMKSDEIGLVV